ncbi:hypothetical protein [Actinomyces ruminicola]|uniref:Uncharacterized protein n=1 Tax=Actinomyces ruminicola TaxID=332524 RepID=A0A1G9TKG8_9ACTO|nr:hypothetical protein [Actinomyces ruminicola]SDM48266.1 hypothetical protein SAMN04487766_10338 [Actinomyces ruminicola]
MHDDHSAGPAGRRDDEPDIDAEFAAMMEGLQLPSEPSDLPEATGPVSTDDVPHNVYGLPGSAASAGSVGSGDDAELPPEQLAEVEALAAALDADANAEDGGAKAVKIAVVLTPLASADALAALCAAGGLDCWVVPSRSGAIAVKEFVSAHAEWDIAELLGGTDTEPAEAAELAGALSRLSRLGVVLMTADLATDVGIESGLSGTITARRYQNGEAGEETSAGLLLASADQTIEDILLGVTRAEGVPGAVRTSEVKPGRVMRWLGRGMRQRGRGRDQGDQSGN